MAEYFVNPNPGYVSPASNVAPAAVSPMANVAPFANAAPVSNVAPMVNIPPVAPLAAAPSMVSPAHYHRPYGGSEAILVLFILLVIILRVCF